MPTKPKTAFVCQSCGNQFPKWIGRCPSCQGWNTLVEERVVAPPKGRGDARAPREAIPLDDVSSDAETRISTGISEFDRVLGGGVVRGSLVLLGGDPGIGKSSLLMQASASLAERGTVLYVSGEESATQIKLRARRFGIESHNILVLAETDLGTIIEAIRRVRPIFTVIDLFIVWMAVRWPAWLAVPLALFAAEQTWDHGPGTEPVVVAIAALLSAYGAWTNAAETTHERTDR